jgi:hypothetical protein
MNYFASEHGKNLCDGEAAIEKSCVNSFFGTGTFLLPSLTELVEKLTSRLSEVKADSNLKHSIALRKFFGIARE